MAIEATEIIGSLHREVEQRVSGYYASELRTMLEKLPSSLQHVALSTERSIFEEEKDDHDERKRILIVDDSALMLDMARSALEEAGYSVDTAQVLSQITDEEKLRTFDLILLDVMMPELQGDDVAMILRAEIQGVTAAIYLLSSLSKTELAERSRLAGTDGFICKRDGIDALVRKVHQILGDDSAS